MIYHSQMKSTPIDGITIADHEPVVMGESRWTRKAIEAEIDAYLGEGASEFFEGWSRSELLRDFFNYVDVGKKYPLMLLDEIKAAHFLAYYIEMYGTDMDR